MNNTGWGLGAAMLLIFAAFATVAIRGRRTHSSREGIMDEDASKRIAQQVMGEQVFREGLSPGAIFRHHEGGLYTIMAVSVMQGTWETLITYRSNKNGTAWTHPLSEFLRDVRSGPMPGLATTPRFRRVDE